MIEQLVQMPGTETKKLQWMEDPPTLKTATPPTRPPEVERSPRRV